MRQLERQLDERRRIGSSSEAGSDLVKSLKQQLRAAQDECRALLAQHMEQLGDRDHEVAELEDRLLACESELQAHEETAAKLRRDKERLQAESVRHAQTTVDVRSELVEAQRIGRKLDRENADLRRQVDSSKKLQRDL